MASSLVTLSACGGGGSSSPGGTPQTLPTTVPTALPLSLPADAVFVTNFNGGSVSVIDPATNTVIKTFGGFSQPSSIAGNAASPYVYFVDFYGLGVLAIDTRSGAVSPVGGGCAPASVTMRPGSLTAYYTESCGIAYDTINGASGNTLTYYNLNNTATVLLGFVGGWQLLAVPSQPLLYFADTNNGKIFRYNEQTGALNMTTVHGSSAWSFAANAAGTMLYAGTDGDHVDVIATSTNSNIGSIAVGPPGNIVESIALNPANERYLYACDTYNNVVAKIDLQSMSVVSTIAVGHHPDGIAINAAGDTAYVANDADGTVSVVNLTTNTVLATIAVGLRPRAILIRE